MSTDLTDFAQSGADTDATAAIHAALHATPEVHLPHRPGGRPYAVHAPIVVPAGRSLSVPMGVELRRAGDWTGPVVCLAGSYARLTGSGTITALGPAPAGIVSIGPVVATRLVGDAQLLDGGALASADAVFTDTDVGRIVTLTGPKARHTATVAAVEDGQIVLTEAPPSGFPIRRVYLGDRAVVGWAEVSDVRIVGSDEPESVGLLVSSSPQGTGGLTFAATVARCVLERVGVGVRLAYQANGNTLMACSFQRIGRCAIEFDNVMENVVLGGFVHHSHGIQTVVAGRSARRNVVAALSAEPGGDGLPYLLDADCRRNVVQIAFNGTGVGLDHGAENTTWSLGVLDTPRLRVSQVLVVPTHGPAAEPGAVHLDDPGQRLSVGTSAGLRHTGLRERDLLVTVEVPAITVGPGGWQSQSIPLDGCAPGDLVTATPTSPVADGVLWSAVVGAPGHVELRLGNLGSAPVQTPSQWTIGILGPPQRSTERTVSAR